MCAVKTTARQFKKVEQASVRLTKKMGQGVIIPGGFILTAAHCISWDIEGGMPLGDFYLEPVKSRCGEFAASVEAVEPVSDIAILGPPDRQNFYDEFDSYQMIIAKLLPVPISLIKPKPFQPLPAFIRTHKETWIRAEAQLGRKDAPTLRLKTEEQVESGTSGGPVVDEDGCLLGVISHSSENMKDCSGSIPRPYFTLPCWIVKRIKDSSRENTR